MTDLWHYAVGSERKGPVTQATLGKLLAAGEISAETYVWQPGMDSWVHLGDVAGLKPLVAGVGADRPVEAFVEEDTAFTSPAEVLATHSVLAEPEATVVVANAVITEVEAVDDDDFVSEDTVVEAVDETLGAAGVSFASAIEVAAVEVASVEVESAEPARDDEPAVAAAAAIEEADLFDPFDSLEPFGDEDAAEPAFVPLALNGVTTSAGAPAVSASGVDIFGDTDTDDIFAAAAPASAPLSGRTVGKHSRHANSVLFSLDELGREGADQPRAAGASDDPFVTDTSGLIDIKAIADSQQTDFERSDPFGGAGFQSVQRPVVGTVAVPIVARRSNVGPWILAAAALLLVGGAIVAYVIVSGDKPAEQAGPTLVASATVEGAAVTPPAAPSEPVAVAAAAAAAAPEPAAGAEEGAAAAGGDPAGEAKADGEPAADGEAVAAAGGEGAEGEGAEGEGAEGKGAEAAAEPAEPAVAAVTPRPKPATTVRRPRTESDGPAAVVAEVSRPTTTASAPAAGNTRRVNALLEKLNAPSDSGATTTTETSGLPAKLSAAALRQTLRQNRDRFARCGDMVEGGQAGSVKVSTSFVIEGKSGEVLSARVVNAGGTSAAVQRCVVEELRKTTFSRFADNTMTVNFPIQLL